MIYNEALEFQHYPKHKVSMEILVSAGNSNKTGVEKSNFLKKNVCENEFIFNRRQVTYTDCLVMDCRIFCLGERLFLLLAFLSRVDEMKFFLRYHHDNISIYFNKNNADMTLRPMMITFNIKRKTVSSYFRRKSKRT